MHNVFFTPGSSWQKDSSLVVHATIKQDGKPDIEHTFTVPPEVTTPLQFSNWVREELHNAYETGHPLTAAIEAWAKNRKPISFDMDEFKARLSADTQAPAPQAGSQAPADAGASGQPAAPPAAPVPAPALPPTGGTVLTPPAQK